MVKLGDKVRVYTDWWGAKCVFCLPCAQTVGEDNVCTISYPAYAEGVCEQCGEPQYREENDGQA